MAEAIEGPEEDVLDVDELEELEAGGKAGVKGADKEDGEDEEYGKGAAYCRRFYQIKLTREQALCLKETTGVLRRRGALVQYGTHRGGEAVDDEYDAIRWLVENAEKSLG